MIINDSEAAKRLASPMNLINKLKTTSNRSSAMSLFGIGRQASPDKKKEEIKEIKVTFNPFQTKEPLSSLVPTSQPLQVSPSEKLDNILEDHESQIKLGLAHDHALNLLNRSVDMLSSKLDDIKADRLPQVISAASKTVESIRRERNEASKNNKDREVHFHFYTPQQKKISEYEVIDVTA
jgi:hypothetical protein